MISLLTTINHVTAVGQGIGNFNRLGLVWRESKLALLWRRSRLWPSAKMDSTNIHTDTYKCARSYPEHEEARQLTAAMDGLFSSPAAGCVTSAPRKITGSLNTGNLQTSNKHINDKNHLKGLCQILNICPRPKQRWLHLFKLKYLWFSKPSMLAPDVYPQKAPPENIIHAHLSTCSSGQYTGTKKSRHLK